MRNPLLLLAALGFAASLTLAQTRLYVTPDVPTDESASATTILPSQISLYDGSGPAYSLTFTVPGDPAIDAIHKMDGLGDWLFSVESASDLGGALPADAEPRDVILFDGATATYSICLSGAAVGIPDEVNVDAVYLEGGDTGNLILSFDVPTDLGAATTFDPGDLVRFAPTGAGVCPGWAVAAANPAFDASAAGTGIPTSSNLIGADQAAGLLVLSFDVPTDLGPPGVSTYTPGQLVSWDGATFALLESLAGWPVSSGVDGVSALADPGSIEATLFIAKSAIVPGDLTLTWNASCSQGGSDYGIYEGTIGTWYSHAKIDDCTDDGGNLTEEVTPAAGSSYYLVVPHNGIEEGSYGTDTTGAERPVGTVVCVAPQVITPCPL